MKYYILVDPFTYKPLNFTTLRDEGSTASRRTTVNGEIVIESRTILCVETEYDPSLLKKTFDPSTNSFVD